MEGKKLSLKFTPPKEEAGNLPKYASYVVNDGMKVHHRTVDAKNSWRNRGWTRQIDPNQPKKEGYNGIMRDNYRNVTRHAFILQNVDGEWFVLYEIKPGLTEQELPWYKEYIKPVGSTWDRNGWLYTDKERNSEYYQKALAEGSYKLYKKATPMTREEYAEWRVSVDRERFGRVVPLVSE